MYYPPFATLIRLLALQGASPSPTPSLCSRPLTKHTPTAICWHATQLTLALLDHVAHPLTCWTAVGTTSCCLRIIQLCVTSNIMLLGARTPHQLSQQHHPPTSTRAPVLGPNLDAATIDGGASRRACQQHLDWDEVLLECVLPASVAYAATAWALVLGRKFG